MKALRTIECALAADGTPDVRVPLYAGVAGEHNSTELVFKGDVGVFASGNELARISFCGGDGTVVSTDLLAWETDADGWRVRYALPSFLTVLGGQITARLVLSHVENGEETQTAISGGVVLFLDDGGTENGTPFWTAVSQMLAGTVQAAEEAKVCAANMEDLWNRANHMGVGGVRYRGEASHAVIVADQKAVVGDIYYNTDQSAFYLRAEKQWLRIGDKHESPTAAEMQWIAQKAAVENTHVAIPKTIHVVVGEEFRMYYKNVISKPSARLWIGYTGHAADEKPIKCYADYVSITMAEAGTTSLEWKVYDEAFRVLASGTTQVIATDYQPKTLRVLAIGDSLVAQQGENGQSAMMTALSQMCQQGGGHATLLGTRGTEACRHEGRGGWTATDYCAADSVGDVVNPFFNSGKGFDFSYYMNQQGYDGVDVVILQLGINDIYRQTYENLGASVVASGLETIVNSIITYDPSIRVIVNLPTVPNGNGTGFADAYGTMQMDFVHLVNTMRLSNALMERFKGYSQVTLCPNNCVLDASVDIRDGVHPTVNGYYTLARTIHAAINGVFDGESGDGESDEPMETPSASLWDLPTRTGVKRPDSGMQAAAAREMKPAHYYYLDAYSGTVAAGDKFTLNDYAATADSLAFTVNATSGTDAATLSAFGVSVPLALEVGKTYMFTCQAAGANMGVRLVMYTVNGDNWTYVSNDTICYNSTSLCEKIITPEAGKGYAIHFSQKSAGVGTKNVFTGISLSEYE